MFLEYRAKTWEMNDTQRDRESVSDKRWAPFADLTPSIHLSLPLSAPSTVPLSTVSFSPSPLRSCLCLAAAGVWRTQTKEFCLSWRKSKGLGSLEGEVGGAGVAGCQGWTGIVKAVATHCCSRARSWSNGYLARLFHVWFPPLSTCVFEAW